MPMPRLAAYMPSLWASSKGFLKLSTSAITTCHVTLGNPRKIPFNLFNNEINKTKDWTLVYNAALAKEKQCFEGQSKNKARLGFQPQSKSAPGLPPPPGWAPGLYLGAYRSQAWPGLACSA